MNLFQFRNFKVFLLLYFLLLSTTLFGVVNPNFTELEKKWIAKNPVVVLGSDYNWPPYDFISKNKKHTGIAADYLKLISQKSGLKFKVKAGVWTDIMKEMKESKLDGLACAVQTPQRDEFLTFTKPYMSMPLAIMVQNTRKDINSIEDLRGLNVVVNKDSYLHEWLVENHPEINLLITSSNVKSLEAVSFNKADAYIGNLAVASYIIREHYLSNLEVVSKIEGVNTDVSIAIDNNKTTLVEIIAKSLALITEEEHNKIKKNWFNFKELDGDKVDLTSEE